MRCTGKLNIQKKTTKGKKMQDCAARTLLIFPSLK
jgi:hypothetical protein